MVTKRNTTLVRFYIKTASYISGEGSSEKYELFEYPLNAAGQKNSLIWVNWQSLFGSELREMEIKGIKQPAKIQCPYIPALYDALLRKEVLVYKWREQPIVIDGVPDLSQPGWYRVTSGVENVHEENRTLEFNVNRYEKN